MVRILFLLLIFSCGKATENNILKGSIIPTEEFDSLSASSWLVSDGYANGLPFDCDWMNSRVSVGSGVLRLSLDASATPQSFACGEIRSTTRYQYGKFEVRMRPASGSGIVSSFFLYNGTPHDEIDIEFLGKDTTKMQVNYFKNGVGGHEQIIDLGFDAASGWHTYAIEWRENSISWFVDGQKVHTVNGNASTLPSVASHLYMNLWNGTGVDGWLGPFNYTGPLEAAYDYVRISP